MRVLVTHKKQYLASWVRRVEVLDGWENEIREAWHVKRSPIYLLYRDLKWACRIFRMSRRYDAVVTGSERPALLFALMQRIARRHRVPHVLLECMWNVPQGSVARRWRLTLLRRVAEAVDRIVVYARHQRRVYSELLDVAEEKFIFVPSHSTLYDNQYPTLSGDYIFSGGYTNRD